jgi:hypothetical protein
MRTLDLFPTYDPLDEARARGTMSITDLDERLAALGRVSMYQGLFQSPCSCRGQVAADFLTALGHDEEAILLFRDYSPRDAAGLGHRLTGMAKALRETWDGQLGRTVPGEGQWFVWFRRMAMRRRVTIGEAILAIENTGHWYLAVARQGSGVRASF